MTSRCAPAATRRSRRKRLAEDARADRTVEVKGDKLVIPPENQRLVLNFGWGRATARRLRGHGPATECRDHRRARANPVDKVRGTLRGDGRRVGRPSVRSLDVQSLKLSIAGSETRRPAAARRRRPNMTLPDPGDVDAARSPTQNSGVDRRIGRHPRPRQRDRRCQTWAPATSTSPAARSARSAKAGSGDVNCC